MPPNLLGETPGVFPREDLCRIARLVEGNFLGQDWAMKQTWETPCFNDSTGSGCASPLFEFIAEKRSVKFRFPEAASRHWVQTTHSRLSLLHERKGWFPNGADTLFIFYPAIGSRATRGH